MSELTKQVQSVEALENSERNPWHKRLRQRLPKQFCDLQNVSACSNSNLECLLKKRKVVVYTKESH